MCVCVGVWVCECVRACVCACVRVWMRRWEEVMIESKISFQELSLHMHSL